MLEGVDVEERHPDPSTRPTGGRQRLLEPVVEEGAVGQTREVVVQGAVLELELDPLACRDVERLDHQVEGLTRTRPG